MKPKRRRLTKAILVKNKSRALFKDMPKPSLVPNKKKADPKYPHKFD